MELDNRIVNDKIFTPFDSADCMKWWINLEGYFADDYCDFSDLDKYSLTISDFGHKIVK